MTGVINNLEFTRSSSSAACYLGVMVRIYSVLLSGVDFVVELRVAPTGGVILHICPSLNHSREIFTFYPRVGTAMTGLTDN